MKITVITVARNGVSTIKRTINSVLGQGYADLEYIIVDNNSTDGTSELIESYLDRVSLYIREKDEGIYDAMNNGIQYATGDIIGILNSDDYYESGALFEIVKAFSESNADIVYGDAMLFDGMSQELYPICEKDLWKGMGSPHPATFIRRDVYRDYGCFD